MGIFAIFSTIIMAPVALGGALLYGAFTLLKWLLPLIILGYILDAVVDVPEDPNNRKH